MDIHPNAEIGTGILLDHASGLVIGENTIIGSNCTIYHNVTLGSNGFDSKKDRLLLLFFWG